MVKYKHLKPFLKRDIVQAVTGEEDETQQKQLGDRQDFETTGMMNCDEYSSRLTMKQSEVKPYAPCVSGP